MSNYTTYVGMDVHARSIDCSAIDVTTGESFRKVFSGNPTAAEVSEWLFSLPQPLYCAYESGCTGFHLCRNLRELGVDCDIIAVSTLAKSDKNKKGKCDKNDARAIRREIANPGLGGTGRWYRGRFRVPLHTQITFRRTKSADKHLFFGVCAYIAPTACQPCQ